MRAAAVTVTIMPSHVRLVWCKPLRRTPKPPITARRCETARPRSLKPGDFGITRAGQACRGHLLRRQQSKTPAGLLRPSTAPVAWSNAHRNARGCGQAHPGTARLTCQGTAPRGTVDARGCGHHIMPSHVRPRCKPSRRTPKPPVTARRVKPRGIGQVPPPANLLPFFQADFPILPRSC